MYSPAHSRWIQYTEYPSLLLFTMKNARRPTKSSAPRPAVRRMRGRGDFTESSPPTTSTTVTVPQQLNRIEKKLDSSLHNRNSSTLGSGLGRVAGSLLGQGDLGASAGDAIQRWLGYGDYNLVSNSLIKGVDQGSKSSSIPTFSKDGRRGIRITEREFLGDVISSTTANTFTNQSFRINPADPTTFPWLSTLANQFDSWEPLGIIFEFNSTSSSQSPGTQALGTVITATDYDPTDPAFTNKLVMESSDYSRSARADCNIQHGIECDLTERGVRTLYTSYSLPTVDQRLTDLGNFQIASVGVNAGSVNLGELWVTYDIAFYKKQLTGGQVGGQITDFAMTSAAPVNTTDPCGISALSFRKGGTLPMTVTKIAGNTRLAFPPNIQTGFYSFDFFASATGVTFGGNIFVPESTASLAVSQLHLIAPAGNSSTASGAAISPVNSRGIYQVLKAGAAMLIPDASITYTGVPSLCDVRVFQLAPCPLTLTT